MEKFIIVLSGVRPLRPESFRICHFDKQFCNLKPLELGLYFGATVSSDMKIFHKTETLIRQKKKQYAANFTASGTDKCYIQILF